MTSKERDAKRIATLEALAFDPAQPAAARVAALNLVLKIEEGQTEKPKSAADKPTIAEKRLARRKKNADDANDLALRLMNAEGRPN
jgi:hypothetical protein